MTDLVKGTVAQGRVPPPPEAHVINYTWGSAVELFMVAVSLVFFSKLVSIKKKRLHLKPLNSHLLCFDAHMEQ